MNYLDDTSVVGDIKVADDVISPDEASEEGELEETGLDDDYIDPFGDKWEA